MVKQRGAQILQKSISHLKIVGTKTVTWRNFHTQDPQVLGTSVQNLVATENRCLVFDTPGLVYLTI